MEAGGPGSNWTVCFTGLKNIVTKEEVRGGAAGVRRGEEGSGGFDFRGAGGPSRPPPARRPRPAARPRGPGRGLSAGAGARRGRPSQSLAREPASPPPAGIDPVQHGALRGWDGTPLPLAPRYLTGSWGLCGEGTEGRG